MQVHDSDNIPPRNTTFRVSRPRTDAELSVKKRQWVDLYLDFTSGIAYSPRPQWSLPTITIPLVGVIASVQYLGTWLKPVTAREGEGALGAALRVGFDESSLSPI